jgi:hypothetical protein
MPSGISTIQIFTSRPTISFQFTYISNTLVFMPKYRKQDMGGRPARKADNLPAICEPTVQQMWEPRRLNQQEPPQLVTWIALPFYTTAFFMDYLTKLSVAQTIRRILNWKARGRKQSSGIRLEGLRKTKNSLKIFFFIFEPEISQIRSRCCQRTSGSRSQPGRTEPGTSQLRSKGASCLTAQLIALLHGQVANSEDEQRVQMLYL